jgi:dihydroorotate dehydrogenase (NAD+) catalytic subunit
LHATGARVIASIWGRTTDDFAEAAAVIASARDSLVALEVNVSCPNLGDRARMFAHSCESTSAVIEAVVSNVGDLPVFAKLSPNVTDIREIAGAALDAGASGLTLINTVLGMAIDPRTRRFRLGAGGGGLSGPAIKPVAVRAVYDVAEAFPGVAIIGTGGVAGAEDVVEMLLAGATAVGVGTATFRDPRAPQRIVKDLVRWCARHGVERVTDLIGGVQP